MHFKKLHKVAQPLHYRSADKNRTFERIDGFSEIIAGEGREQSVF